jgi:AraC-like DNA-binding protein
MTLGLKLTVYRPTGRLASYVHQFQVLSAEKGTEASVLDFCGADVSVPLRFGDPVFVEDPALTEVQSAALVGPRTRSVWLRFTGSIDQVNISLFPGVAGAFVGLSMPELVGRMAPPDDVWPHDFREAVADLEPLPVEERIFRLEALLFARLDPRWEAGVQVREAVRLINARRGRVQVRWLADQVNLSVSQLERNFKQHVGVGPKLLARQTRASAVAREVMKVRRIDWARLAYKCGYSDQAHLAREFRHLMGLTPSVFGRIGADADFLQDALSCPMQY